MSGEGGGDWLLIRCGRVGQPEEALARHLRRWFGERVRFVSDQTDEPAPPQPDVIPMTRRALGAMGLAVFPRAGWRCGDYAYYVAAAALPQMQRAWLIEGDVRLTHPDPADLFRPLEWEGADFLAPFLAPRGPEWFWFWMTRQVMGTDAVHGCLFPMTRMTRRAIERLAVLRAETIAAARANPPQSFADVVPFPVPNDEGFVATAIAREGFVGRDLAALAPGAFSQESFWWDAPIAPAEADLPALAGRVIHPVLPPAQARIKLAQLALRRPERLAERRAEVVARLGLEAWQAWSGMD